MSDCIWLPGVLWVLAAVPSTSPAVSPTPRVVSPYSQQELKPSSRLWGALIRRCSGFGKHLCRLSRITADPGSPSPRRCAPISAGGGLGEPSPHCSHHLGKEQRCFVTSNSHEAPKTKPAASPSCRNICPSRVARDKNPVSPVPTSHWKKPETKKQKPHGHFSHFPSTVTPLISNAINVSPIKQEGCNQERVCEGRQDCHLVVSGGSNLFKETISNIQ